MVLVLDVFSGGISVGSSGVSFWGGAGADTFNFTTVLNSAGTAYFWNDDAGTDSINLVVLSAQRIGSSSFGFGVTTTAWMYINFGYANEMDASSCISALARCQPTRLLTATNVQLRLRFNHDNHLPSFAGGASTLSSVVLLSAAGTTLFDFLALPAQVASLRYCCRNFPNLQLIIPFGIIQSII